MKLFPFIISAATTVGLVTVLNSTLFLPAPLGKILNPQSGVWQNAESANENFNANLSFPNLKGNANVYFDERLVPHVFAENDEDIYLSFSIDN